MKLIRRGSARVRTVQGRLGLATLCALVAVAVAGSAAGQARPTARPAAVKSVGSITIGGVFCTCHTDVYTAWKQGFFEKHGVTVKGYVLTQGGSLTFAGVNAGTFDFGAATLETVVRGKAVGRPVRAIANLYPEFWALSVREDLRGQIRSAADLKGRTVGVSRIGSGSWAFLVGLLGKNGLSKTDVNIVELGDANGILSALKAKRVDASVTWDPGTTAGVRGKISAPIINLQNPGETKKLLGSDVSMSQVLIAREDLLKNKPELAAAVVAAIRDADIWLLSRKRKPIQVTGVIKQIAPGTISTGTILEAIRSTLRVQPKTPKLTREGYDTSTKLLLDTGALTKAIPFDDVVDCRFAGCT